ncbi:MAG: hypothetical protein H6835_10980 [Planctomycetes bacterium]|nr:hypothetical protein [Planctomycetota bacterium]
MPFRFGAVTVTETELLTCRIRVRTADGRDGEGWSGDLLAPRWFRKDNDATPQQDADELFASVVAAADAFCGVGTATPFGLWQQVFGARVTALGDDQPDLLVRGFGVAIVERALLDAACRLRGRPFAAALRDDVFGFRPGDVHAQLADWDWRRDLPTPRRSIAVRHTVGMLDPLRAVDVPEARRVADGLPQALEEDLDAYRPRWLKIKIGAGVDVDRARLAALAEFFEQRDEAPGFSLDGNEQYEDLTQLAELLDAVAAEPRGARFLERLLWIEQPLARAVTFDPERHRAIDRVTRRAPLILDEADATPRSFLRALELGYRGVSVKNCKGVFRALCNFGICRRGEGRFQTGEDLTNIGVLPLQQDLVTMSVLGLPHVERNGHHYCRGLDHLPAELVQRAREAHGDLWRELAPGREGHGGAALRIEGGEVAIGSLLDAQGFGTALGELSRDLQVVARG